MVTLSITARDRCIDLAEASLVGLPHPGNRKAVVAEQDVNVVVIAILRQPLHPTACVRALSFPDLAALPGRGVVNAMHRDSLNRQWNVDGDTQSLAEPAI